MKTVNCILKYWVIQQCRITISWQLTPLWADDSTSRSNKIESPNLISWHRQNWIRIKSSSFYNMLADEKLNSLTKKSEINKIGCARSTWLDVTLIILMKEQLLWRIARGCAARLSWLARTHTRTRVHTGFWPSMSHKCRFLIQSFAFLTSSKRKVLEKIGKYAKHRSALENFPDFTYYYYSIFDIR